MVFNTDPRHCLLESKPPQNGLILGESMVLMDLNAHMGSHPSQNPSVGVFNSKGFYFLSVSDQLKMAVQAERRLAAIMFTDIVGYTALAQHLRQ